MFANDTETYQNFFIDSTCTELPQNSELPHTKILELMVTRTLKLLGR